MRKRPCEVNDRQAQGTVPVLGVMFDLDGTLLNTGSDLAAAANAVRLDMGLPALAESRLVNMVGKGADRLMHRVLTDDLDGQAAPSDFTRARALFDKHYANLNGTTAVIYPGVIECLGRLRQAGLRVACVTNKPLQFTHPLLRLKGLAQWFDPIVGGDSFAAKKPDPLPLLEVARGWQLEPGHCVMVGDSINDVQAARSAGMRVWAVPYGYNEGRDIQLAQPDGIVKFLDQLPRALFIS
jgi:phosphoglycolate phosphatase